MTPLQLLPTPDGTPPTIALIAAHCDDLEIGAGGLLLRLAHAHPGLRVAALVLTSTPEREKETRAALPAFLPGADVDLTVCRLPDGRLPAFWADAKQAVESLRRSVEPDLVLAPAAYDAHQDHRLLAELTPTAFRDHLILGYEILKWDGDLGRPNVYVPLSTRTAELKWDLLDANYPSQRGRSWFDREALLGLARVRGVECQQRYAEAFTSNKMVVTF